MPWIYIFVLYLKQTLMKYHYGSIAQHFIVCMIDFQFVVASFNVVWSPTYTHSINL